MERVSTHHLNEAERQKLAEVNRLLTELTTTHGVNCACEMCEARWRTDVQDEESFHFNIIVEE